MSSITALEMLNRVRLFRRQPTTTVIATPEDQVTLNSINMAIEDVLSTRKWEFDLRTDGQLTLRGRLTGASVVIFTPNRTVGTFNKDVADLVDSDVFGDYVVRLLVGGSTSYSNTALRIVSATPVAFDLQSTLTFETSFEENVSGVDAELHYSEYILPDTVSEVVRATYQEDPIELNQVDPTVRYSEIFPRPHDHFGPPEVLAVGGFDVKTYDSGGDTPDPGLRMAVWPVPDEDYIINYSYYFRHPELTVATSTLDGVPSSVVNDIVFQATSTVMMTWDQNFAAAHFTDLAREQAATKHQVYGGSNARRHTIHSFEGGGMGRSFNDGFPGKVIG